MGIKSKVKRSVGAEEHLLVDAFDEFYEEKEIDNRSIATLKNYELTFRLFFEFHEFNNTTTTESIEQSHIYKWVNTMKQDDVKYSTINHYLRDIGAFLHWCMDTERGYITPFKLPKQEKQEEEPKAFSDEELDLLLEKPKKNALFTEWRTYAIVNWVMATGNRAATICEVKIRDINFAKRELSIWNVKGKKFQIVPLSSSLETCLKEYIKMWRRDADLDGWLFPNIGEEKLTTNALRLSFSKYCKDRGCEHTNIHGLRHSFAKGWIRNNGNQFALQKVLGHSKLDMTSKYVRLYGEEIKEDYDRFSPLDTIKKEKKRTQAVKRSRD